MGIINLTSRFKNDYETIAFSGALKSYNTTRNRTHAAAWLTKLLIVLKGEGKRPSE